MVKNMKRALNYLWRLDGFTRWNFTYSILYSCLFALHKKEHYKYAYFFVRLWCKGVFMAWDSDMNSLIRPTKIDRNQQYVIIANHTSIVDILFRFYYSLIILFVLLVKGELVKIPIFGTIYKRICVMVDRSSPKAEQKSMKDAQNVWKKETAL